MVNLHRPLRINFLLAHPGVGGGDRVISRYARYLVDHGHHVTVTALPPKMPTLVQRAKLFVRTSHFVRYKDHLQHYRNAGIEIRHAKAPGVITDADIPDADILIATYWATAAWALNMSAAKGVKTYFVQGHEARLPGARVERVEETYRAPLQKIVVSKWLETAMREDYGAPPAACIHNSVDSKHFNAPPRGKSPSGVVGFIYGDSRIKGVDVTLAAIDKIRAVRPETQVVAFGGSPINKLLPLPKDIAYQYKPPQKRIPQLYAGCDVWLCGSRLEGFGLPMLEAMACRTPVVTTNVGAAEDLIENGREGYVVPVDDAAAMAERALSVLNASD
ncbi:MAG: glycosyltransferase family 4 protein, partial [Hyphococcus sp.]